MRRGGDLPPGRRTTPRPGGLLRAGAGVRRAGTPAAARWVALAAAAAVVSGCTTATPPGDAEVRHPRQPAPVLTTIDEMTAVPEAVECANERLDGRRSTLPGPGLLPKALTGAVTVRLVLPGRDAADLRCHVALAKRFSCRDTTTWAVPDPAEFLLTFGARQVRVVEGASSALTQSTEDGHDPGPPKRSFTYAEFLMASGDAQGAVAFERRAFETCALARERTVEGVAAFTASVGAESGLTDVAFLVEGDRLALLALSGSRWADGERDHAVQVVAQYLRQEA